MSGSLIAINIDSDLLQQEVARMVEAITHPEDAMDNIGMRLANSARDRFHDGKDPNDRPWVPLNPLYKESKEYLGGSNHIMVFHGILEDSIVHAIGLDRSSVDVGTQMIYGAIHQFGGIIRAKNKNGLHFTMGFEEPKEGGEGDDRELRHHIVQSVTIPARPYLGLSKEDEEEIVAILADHIAGVGGE